MTVMWLWVMSTGWGWFGEPLGTLSAVCLLSVGLSVPCPTSSAADKFLSLAHKTCPHEWRGCLQGRQPMRTPSLTQFNRGWTNSIFDVWFLLYNPQQVPQRICHKLKGRYMLHSYDFRHNWQILENQSSES